MKKDNKDAAYAKKKMQEGLFSIVFAENKEDRTEEKATKMAAEIDSAEGVACFKSDDGDQYWGVLINSGKIAKKKQTKEKQKEENA